MHSIFQTDYQAVEIIFTFFKFHGYYSDGLVYFLLYFVTTSKSIYF